jgi:hypothetical protein
MQPLLTGPAAVLSREIDALHKDLLAFAAKMDRWFDRIDQQFDRIDRQFDRLDQTLDRADLKPDLAGDCSTPGLRRDIADAVRQAFRERKKKS